MNKKIFLFALLWMLCISAVYADTIVYGNSNFKRILNDLNTSRVDIIGIGDSNQVQNGWGWDQGFAFGLINSSIPMYATGASSANENRGSGSGLGYWWGSGNLGFQLGNWTGNVSYPGWTQFMMNETLGNVIFPAYVNLGQTIAGTAASGILLTANHSLYGIIDTRAALRTYYLYGTNGTAGNFSAAMRIDEPPYTTITTAQINGSRAGQGYNYSIANISINADIGRNNTGARWAGTSGSMTGAQAFFWTKIEQINRSNGFAYNTYIYQGGVGARRFLQSLVNSTNASLQAYYDIVTIGQNVSKQNKKVIWYVISAGNDINDAAPSYNITTNTFTGVESNIPKGFGNNIVGLYNYTFTQWMAGGYNPSNYMFVYGGYHDRPGNTSINGTVYNLTVIFDLYADQIVQARNNGILSQDNSAIVYMQDIVNASKITANGWYASGGTDTAHLTQQGYEGIGYATIQTLLAFTPESPSGNTTGLLTAAECAQGRDSFATTMKLVGIASIIIMIVVIAATGFLLAQGDFDVNLIIIAAIAIVVLAVLTMISFAIGANVNITFCPV